MINTNIPFSEFIKADVHPAFSITRIRFADVEVGDVITGAGTCDGTLTGDAYLVNVRITNKISAIFSDEYLRGILEDDGAEIHLKGDVLNNLYICDFRRLDRARTKHNCNVHGHVAVDMGGVKAYCKFCDADMWFDRRSALFTLYDPFESKR